MEERRTGRILWGGRDIAGKEVLVETVVYHLTGRVKDLQGGVFWFDEAVRVFNDDGDSITQKQDIGTISIRADMVISIGFKGEVAWFQ